MDPKDIRAWARRPWAEVEDFKRRYQAERQTRDPLAALLVAELLWRHMRQLRPDWPTPEDRAADYEHHVRMRRLLDRTADVLRRR